ncbi:VOC family protein [Coralloluteibacterium thermophilus]|uniref:VOC family protein n=1 Tax=Coralloluteibacterium thermophilum TaxID=2707049 RepID=A0ABV9NJ54_9GAMM
MTTPTGTLAPPIGGLLESALYVDDMARSRRFFEEVLGLRAMAAGERLVAYDAGAGGVLLVFPRGGARADVRTEDGLIPGHDGSGPLHMAFAIAEDDYAPWLARLRAHGVPIRGEMRWERGGRSVYFEDPDGHVLELATPGLWPNR